MGIQNFPAALQPIIQQGFLQREFFQALRSRLAYRGIADREVFPNGVGETVTKTRAGLKPTVTTPMLPSSNTNLDNGLSSTGFGVEQYTLGINMYAATTDLNVITSRVGIASQFLQNAYVNGEQAARSLDEIARNALFPSYFAGNTRVSVTLGTAGVAVQVDDVRGFNIVYVNGVATAVSSSNPLTVTVNGTAYTLNSVVADGTAPTTGAPALMTFSGTSSNSSTAPGGYSGTLTFSANVSTANGTAGNAVIAATASSIIRPSSRATTALLASGDNLTMGNLLDAVAKLRVNAVPEVDGAYNCYLDPVSARQLFADPDFKQLFQGATSAAQVFKSGMVNDFLGVRFVPTTEAYIQTIGSVTVRRPIVCGQGALIEGDYAGMTDPDMLAELSYQNAMVEMVDGVAMVTREPLDRLQQIIAQSWYWVGGFCTPSDTTTNSTTLPTATNANFKRAVMIEHAS